MSRRLVTVLRVAALQERLAKAEAGRAAVAVEDARAVHAERSELLASSRLAVGDPASLQRARALQQLRAQAVGQAHLDTRAAEAARAGALAGWTAARSRHRLLEELDTRVRAEREADEIRSAQALADDLSSGRRRAGTR